MGSQYYDNAELDYYLPTFNFSDLEEGVIDHYPCWHPAYLPGQHLCTSMADDTIESCQIPIESNGKPGQWLLGPHSPPLDSWKKI